MHMQRDNQPLFILGVSVRKKMKGKELKLICDSSIPVPTDKKEAGE